MLESAEQCAETLRELIPVEVATFLKDMLGANGDSQAKRDRIADNLIQTIKQNTDDDWKAIIIRQHASYYLACLKTKKAEVFLEQAYQGEPNKWVQRGMMVGISLSFKRADILDHYLDMLYNDPEVASINTGYHLIYYGDQPLQEGYHDAGGEKCDGTVRAIFRHLRSQEYRIGWPLDLFTLRTLMSTRGGQILRSNEEDLSFLIQFLDREAKRQSRSFLRERRLLRTRLRRLSRS